MLGRVTRRNCSRISRFDGVSSIESRLIQGENGSEVKRACGEREVGLSRGENRQVLWTSHWAVALNSAESAIFHWLCTSAHNSAQILTILCVLAVFSSLSQMAFCTFAICFAKNNIKWWREGNATETREYSWIFYGRIIWWIPNSRFASLNVCLHRNELIWWIEGENARPAKLVFGCVAFSSVVSSHAVS